MDDLKKCDCGGKVEVIDSRLREDGSIRRRRECPDCHCRFTTIEVTQDHHRLMSRKVKAFNKIRSLTAGIVRFVDD